MNDSFRSGIVPVVGRPNVGKSTLVNSLVGEKVTITAPRPQTTRNTIRGVVHRDDGQVVLVDTPGLHRPRNELGERLNQLVDDSLPDSDCVIYVVDATGAIGPGDRAVADRLSEATVVVAVNKTDRAKPHEIADRLADLAPYDFAAYVPTSAKTGEGVDELLAEVMSLLAPGPQFFPIDMLSDQPDHHLAAELVREGYLHRLHEELPHSVAVVTEEMEIRENGTLYISATVYVERDSQKGMVIGKGGKLVKAVGERARADIERAFATPVYLDLRVKVEKDWQRRPELINRLLPLDG
jgi:GTP-binding protein Era